MLIKNAEMSIYAYCFKVFKLFINAIELFNLHDIVVKYKSPLFVEIPPKFQEEGGKSPLSSKSWLQHCK